MIIRSFVADSAASALKEVRTQMGGEAVVLKTRQVRTGTGGVQFEVTACLDNPTAAQATVALAETPRPAASVTATAPSRSQSRIAPEVLAGPTVSQTPPEWDRRLAAIESALAELQGQGRLMTAGQLPRLVPAAAPVRSLLNADLPQLWLTSLLDGLLNRHAPDQITEDLLWTTLTERLTAMIDPEFRAVAGDRVLVMGLAGAGKTSFVGRLASWLVAQRKMSVRLVSLDSYKVGALEEIQSYGDLLGIDIADPTELQSAHDKVVTIIDTGALPSRKEERAEFKSRFDETRPTHRLLVCSALTRTSDMERLASQIAELKPTHLVMTMTDVTSCWGAMIAASVSLGIKVVFATDSPSGTGKMHVPAPATIATQLLSTEVSDVR